MKRTVLYDTHLSLGAKMAPFAGWEMPIQYPAGPIEEHRLVRRSAGLFDTSHMGRFRVYGPGATQFLDKLLTARLSDLFVGFSRYSLLLREDGGILDDLFVYRLGEEEWFIVVNASNTEKNFAWFQQWASKEGTIQIEDLSFRFGMVAFQGPRALELLTQITENEKGERWTPPERFGWSWVRIGKPKGSLADRANHSDASTKVRCLVGRTGYTGEDGVEIFPPWDRTPFVWETILSSASKMGIEAGPAGLAARDSLRFEPGFALYGHELSEDITPVEASLLWACDFEKPFVGREAVSNRKEQGPKEKLATFVMEEPAVPRAGYPVTDEAGTTVGRVVTGLYAPTIDAFAGNAFVLPDLAISGKTLYIVIRGARKKARVVKRPLYKPAYRA
ncbi:MAG: glycine cleavage system aminomethyltransferase GcvT [Spirochaetes bacterium]|nr:glycine cleavage system aminomethyltransferase GcvT [Spirochaetota bacterium]